MTTSLRTNEAGELVIISHVAMPPHLAKLCETPAGCERVEAAIRERMAAAFDRKLQADSRDLMHGIGTERPRGIFSS